MSRELADPAAVLSPEHPLWKLHGAALGPFGLKLTGVRQLASSGWKDFHLTLMHNDRPTTKPVLEGIHSVGGKGIAPWFDVEYRPLLSFATEPDATTQESGVTNLRGQALEIPLFQRLRELITAGGHLSIAYETLTHRDTQLALMRGVPPVATHLGWVVWRAGFNGGFKDWHISEGGHEGPKKLQANVPLNEDNGRQASAAAAVQACRDFQAKQSSASEQADPKGFPGFWLVTNRRIEEVIESLSGN